MAKNESTPEELAQAGLKNVENTGISDDQARADGVRVLGESARELTPAERFSALIERIGAHDAEGVAIETELTSLGKTAKDVKAVKKALAARAAVDKTLAALTGSGL